MFGQLVIGPPGAGKSTYCYGMHQFMSSIGRNCTIINLDPANETLPYPDCSIDIRDFITVSSVMERENLGPNGALLFALESISENSLDALVEMIQRECLKKYLIFDCPGQVELYTHQNSIAKIIRKLEKDCDARLCSVSLMDSIFLQSPSLYISILLLSLRSMLQLDLPHVNVISKIDMLLSYGDLPMRLDYYTEVQNLDMLKPYLELESSTLLSRNYGRLTEQIADLVQDFNLVNFEVLSIENKKSMIHLLQVIDKAIGYSYGATEIGGDLIWAQAIRNGWNIDSEHIDIHERWIDKKQEYDRLEDEEFNIHEETEAV